MLPGGQPVTGKLYEKLIVTPSPTLPAYYNLVKRVLEEAYIDLPPEGDSTAEDFEKWVARWFGDI